jgi:hypothetical protein
MSESNPLTRHGKLSHLRIPAVDVEQSATFGSPSEGTVPYDVLKLPCARKCSTCACTVRLFMMKV